MATGRFLWTPILGTIRHLQPRMVEPIDLKSCSSAPEPKLMPSLPGRHNNLLEKLGKTHPIHQPSPEKTLHPRSYLCSRQAIQEVKTPGSKKELQRFLGIYLLVREYISRYLEVTAPLIDLLRKGVGRWKWTGETGESFSHLRDVFKNPLKLGIPDPDLVYTLHYLSARQFTLLTDSKSLNWLN